LAFVSFEVSSYAWCKRGTADFQTEMQPKTPIVDRIGVRFASVVNDRSNLIQTRPPLSDLVSDG